MEEGMLIKHNSYFYQQKARGYEQSINKKQQNSSWQIHDGNNRKKLFPKRMQFVNYLRDEILGQ